MDQVLVTETSLEDIADAIRDKTGSEDTYTPGQMAGAINGIHTADEVVLVSKSVTANGTYNPASDSADGYSGVTVDVPNSYAATDEGKVVSSGELVAQTSRNISHNGTYDTTENNEVVVDVQSGGGSTLVSKNITQNGTYNPSDDNADGYSQVTVNVNTDVIASFDFTKLNETIHDVVFNQNGANFSTQQGCVLLITQKLNDITIEIGIPSLQLSSGSHRRFVMSKYDEGFIYRSSGVWAIYNGSWEESNVTDGAFLDNSILKIYIDGNDKWHFYKNDVLFFEPNGQIPIYSRYEQTTAQPAYGVFLLGSNNGYPINTGTFSYVRIYNGEHIG